MSSRSLALIASQLSPLMSCVVSYNSRLKVFQSAKHGLRCMQDGGKQYGITTGLLMCFMTELGPQGAEECLQQVWIVLLHKQPAV